MKWWKKITTIWPLVVFVSVILLTFIGWLWFERTGYYQELIRWAEGNVYLIAALVVVIKIIGIVWPPLPGGIFSWAAIPLIGWFGAFMADCVGSIIGNSLAYVIGKKYGFKFLTRLMGEAMVNKIKAVKVKKGKELETILVYRLLMAPIMTEGVSYGAGLLGITYRTMIIGVTIPQVVVNLPYFYVLQFAFGQGNYLLRGLIIGTAVVLIVKLRERYFE